MPDQAISGAGPPVNPERKLVQVVRHGPYAMGRVSIRAQWLIIAADVLLSPVFVFLMACLIGWLLFRRLWLRQEVALVAGSTG